MLQGKIKDRRRRQRQLLNASVQVFTGSSCVSALGINLSEVGMCLFSIANLSLGSKIEMNFFRLGAANACELMGWFGIALFICTESSFWTRIND